MEGTEYLTIEQFREAATNLQDRMAIINLLFKEADALVMKVDIEKFDDEDQNEAYELAHDIAYIGGYQFDRFGPKGGYWLPSTC